jgi:hypothetical protein
MLTRNPCLAIELPSIGLLEDTGTELTLAEDQCLVFIRKNPSEIVPVPEG